MDSTRHLEANVELTTAGGGDVAMQKSESLMWRKSLPQPKLAMGMGSCARNKFKDEFLDRISMGLHTLRLG
jgi:hypothetical protein